MTVELSGTKPGGVFKVRPSGVLIENGRLLLVRQSVTPHRLWSLPGGALEHGETIANCLIRELREETGLNINVGDLLYVTDRIAGGDHVVHMTFLVSNAGTGPLPAEWTHLDPHVSAAAAPMRQIRMVPCCELESCGFGPTFARLTSEGFPRRGAYKGDFAAFYGEP